MLTLLPTLNRVKLLERFLKSVVDAETSTPGILIIDKQDWAKNQKKYEALTLPNGWTFYLTDAVKMGDKVREVWGYVLEGKYTAVNLLNDDHEIVTKHWDTKLLSKIDGTNFVTCQDRWMSPRKAAGATVFSVEMLKELGLPIYPPGMLHLFIDDLWENIGRGTGCWEVTHSVTILHHNQLRTPEERDSTFHEVYGRGPDLSQHELWKNDEKVYQEFMKNDYITAQDKIRKLRGQLEIVRHS